MLITIVTETYMPDVNGVAMTLCRLLNGLVEKGHKLQLVCTNSDEREDKDLHVGVDYFPVKGISIPGYREAKFGLPCRKILEKLWSTLRPDVIYVATEGPLGYSAIKIARAASIPVISGFHTNFQLYSKHYGAGLVSRLVERYLVSLHNRADMTLTPTAEQKNKLVTMGIKSVKVLSRGVDTRLFSPSKRSISLRTSWGIANEHEPVMLYVGRIAAEKNLDLAVETYKYMKRVNKKLRFVLVGDGPLSYKLKKQNPDFIFAGMRTGEELSKYYASSDIFVFPSLTETFGNVVLEAMASGLGVIAYNYAAAGMHIRHGVNGMTAKLRNKYEFISNACDFLGSTEFLEEIRHEASQYALQQSWSEVNNQFENILQEQAFKSFNDYSLMSDSIQSHA